MNPFRASIATEDDKKLQLLAGVCKTQHKTSKLSLRQRWTEHIDI